MYVAVTGDNPVIEAGTVEDRSGQPSLGEERIRVSEGGVVERVETLPQMLGVRKIHGAHAIPPLKDPPQMPNSFLAPANAGAHLLPEAGARHERTLEAVGCRRLFGEVLA